MIRLALKPGASHMSLRQTAPPDQPLAASAEKHSPNGDGGLIAGLRDEGNRTAAVRGVAIGVVLGTIVWAVILWGLL